jgi:hypothetical protein
MRPYDLFPIEKFPPRVREAILMEFDGRCPSIAEVAEIPDAEWLHLPGIGAGILMAIRQVTLQTNEPSPTGVRMTDTELLAERDRLRLETSCLRATLQLQEHQLRAIMAELRVRNLLPHQGSPAIPSVIREVHR